MPLGVLPRYGDRISSHEALWLDDEGYGKPKVNPFVIEAGTLTDDIRFEVTDYLLYADISSRWTDSSRQANPMVAFTLSDGFPGGNDAVTIHVGFSPWTWLDPGDPGEPTTCPEHGVAPGHRGVGGIESEGRIITPNPANCGCRRGARHQGLDASDGARRIVGPPESACDRNELVRRHAVEDKDDVSLIVDG